MVFTEAEGNKPANIELVLGKQPTVQELGAALRIVSEKTWARN